MTVAPSSAISDIAPCSDDAVSCAGAEGRLDRRRGSLGRRHTDLQGRLNGRDGSGQPLDRQRSGVIGRGLHHDGHRDRQVGLYDGAVVPRAGDPNRDVDVDRLILRCHRLILRRGLRSAICIPVCISTAIPIPVPVPDLLEVLRGKHNRGCDHIPAAPRPRPVPGVNRSHRRVGRRNGVRGCCRCRRSLARGQRVVILRIRLLISQLRRRGDWHRLPTAPR